MYISLVPTSIESIKRAAGQCHAAFCTGCFTAAAADAATAPTAATTTAAAAAAAAAASPALIDDRHWHRIVAFFSIRETILQAIFPSFCSLLLCLSVCLPLNYEKSIRSSNVVTANG